MGGGLITDKTQLKSIRENNITKVSKIIAEILADGNSVILVHGAGSYGHLEAKKWKLATGFDEETIDAQRDAVKKVRNDMLELNRYVLDNLESFGMICESHPPSLWACLLYTSPSPRDLRKSRMPSSA